MYCYYYKPLLRSWKEWFKKAKADRVRVPDGITQRINQFVPSIMKEDESMLILVREKLSDGTRRSAPEDG
jgi:hypothetical protein